MLDATGVAGNPASHFHRPNIEDWRRSHDLPADADLAAIIAAAIEKGRGKSDMFGLRLQAQSFAFFVSQLRILHPTQPTDRDRITATFGRTQFIHLTREDKLDQTISFLRALQSGLWHRHADGSEIERLTPQQMPGYSADAIAQQMQNFQQADADWITWFATQGIVPLRITYNDLTATPTTVLGHVLAHVGLGTAYANGVTPDTARLSDATNAAWRQRFLAERSQTQ